MKTGPAEQSAGFFYYGVCNVFLIQILKILSLLFQSIGE
jgi:hypothetical protein